MKCLLGLAFAFVSIASGQFNGLTSTGDGSTVYFSSPLWLRGSSQSSVGKIFRIEAGEPVLFQERDPGTVGNVYSNLMAPDVSSGGAVVAFTGVARSCSSESACVGRQLNQGTVADQAGQEIVRADGYVNISPNGSYAVFSARNTIASVAPAELVDLRSNTHVNAPFSFLKEARRRVSDDGTVVFFVQGFIVLWRADGVQLAGRTSILQPAPHSSSEPLLMISGDGTRLVYQTPTGLAAYDRTNMVETSLMSGGSASVVMSDDARAVAWIDTSDGQVWAASPPRKLTAIPEGFREVTLSGDGHVAFAATKNGRLLRIDVDSGVVTELIPRSPSITNISGVAAGSMVTLTGVNLSEVTRFAESPSSGALGDVRILVNGADVPVLAIAPDFIRFQVPWELGEGSHTFEFRTGQSPFETGLATLYVNTMAPRFFQQPETFDITAAHGDWSGPVTRTNPARPGEIVHMYMYGIGPVSPAVATGAAGPSQPLSRVVGQWPCYFGNYPGIEALSYFAGLAPGMVGVYQVSLQVPDRADLVGIVSVRCGLESPGSFGSLTTSGSLPVASIGAR